MEQLLTKQCPVADRPYSQHELIDTRTRNLERMNIGSVMVCHGKCGHFYLAKAGGKKEAAVLSGEGLEDGCCSVCWKVRKTSGELREHANAMIDSFILRFEKKPEKWSRTLLHLENTFYKWLYIDFDRKRGGDRRYRNNQRDDDGGRYRNNRRDDDGGRYRNNRRDDDGGRYRNNRRDNDGDRRYRRHQSDNFNNGSDSNEDVADPPPLNDESAFPAL